MSKKKITTKKKQTKVKTRIKKATKNEVVEKNNVTDAKLRSPTEDEKQKALAVQGAVIKARRELEELLNFSGANPYGTTDSAIFEDKIATATVGELQTLASKVGVTPIPDMRLLKEELRRAFRDYAMQYGRGDLGCTAKEVFNADADREVRRILGTENPYASSNILLSR